MGFARFKRARCWPLGIALIAAAAAAAQDELVAPTDAYREAAALVSDFIRRELEQKQIPALSIAWVDGDQIVWAEGFGWADPERRVPATAATVYRVGSVSKLLNDVAVMQQIASGGLDLDADIRTVLPEFQPANPFEVPLTLRHLMSHRSGLVRESPLGNYFDDSQPTLRETVLSLNETALLWPPGSKTKYSNAAVAVAGWAVERTCGVDYAEHLQRSLVQPLGMRSSGFVLDPAWQARVARGVMWSDDGRRFPAPEFAMGAAPAGNLYSTVTDLGRFMRAIFNGGSIDGQTILDSQLLEAMLAGGEDGGSRTFGIGFALGQLDGRPTFEHNGAIYGFATQFRGLRREKLGVIVAASLDIANGFAERVGDESLRRMLAVQSGANLPPLRSTEPVERGEARRLAGLYQSGDDFLRLWESGGGLRLQVGSTTHEVRRLDGRLLIDDVLAYGAELELANGALRLGGRAWTRVDEPRPEPPPPRWAALIGEYGWDHNTLFIYERRGQLWALIEWAFHYPLQELEADLFAFPAHGLYHDERLKFERDPTGHVQRVVAAGVAFPRRNLAGSGGETFTLQPLAPPERLREVALAAEPPQEAGPLRESALVELTKLDPSLRLDIRYAGENNFMRTAFYRQPRAFLQRPAAEAVARAQRRLQPLGFGLLIHDAYRPWFVTKMFWEATPPELRHFVADPQRGSRHNRGCAVDLTLCELASGRAVAMVSGYDEFSPRAYPDYPGGSERQRWHRRVLREAMEAEGFEVYEFEWWHFDHPLWREYSLMNVEFEQLQ